MLSDTAIKNRNYASQIVDFRGLHFGTIMPTDLDGLIDFRNKTFVLIEMKHTGGEMPFGQRLAIERLTDIIEETGRNSLALVAEHDCIGDIDCAKAVVIEYRFCRSWRIPQKPLNVRDAIDRFLEWAEHTK